MADLKEKIKELKENSFYGEVINYYEDEIKKQDSGRTEVMRRTLLNDPVAMMDLKRSDPVKYDEIIKGIKREVTQ